MLLERVAQQITGQSAILLIERIREMLAENDVMLKEIKSKADAFFGRDTFDLMQKKLKQSITVPKIQVIFFRKTL